MGEVVRPDFGRRKKKEGTALVTADPFWKGYRHDLIGGDLYYVRSDPDTMKAAKVRKAEISTYIESELGFAHQDDDALTQWWHLKGIPVGSLCIIILSSRALQWRHQRSYFSAVIQEFDARFKVLVEFVDALKVVNFVLEKKDE